MNDIFISPLQNSKEYKDVINNIENNKGTLLINGLVQSQKPNIVYSIFNDLKKQILYIANTDLEAKKVYEDLCFYMKDKVDYLSSQDIYFYHLDAKDRNDEARKLKVLLRMISKENTVIVTSVEAVLSKYVPKEVLKKNIFTYKIGDTIDIENISKKLVNLGYERVSKIEGFGQFSIRGGIIDVFSLEYDTPIRIELFDDEIESIRTFDVFTQKSIKKIKKCTITPSREFIYPENTEESLTRLEKDISKIADDDVYKSIENIKTKTYFEGVENYIDYMYTDENKSIFTYLKEDAVVFINDVSRLKERCENYINEFKENYKLNLERGLALKQQGNLLYHYSDLEYLAQGKKLILNMLLTKSIKDISVKSIVNFESREIPSFNGKLDILAEELTRLKYNGHKVVLATNTYDRAKKLNKELLNLGIETVLSRKRDVEIYSSQVVIVVGNITSGFQYKSIKFDVITDKEMIGSNKRAKTSKSKKFNKGQKIETFLDLNVGDYVVHENSGVGRYVGIDQLSVNGVKKDYMRVVYQGGDNLYVPIDQMDKIQKFIGADTEKVKLNKLGSSEWSKAKAKVKKEIEDMTKDLVELYAKREKIKGYRFSKDTLWQSEFETLFPYQETDDQIKAIEETKKDMESNKVMDRLICGDVGYGKTEVAIRAIFKACMDQKQVAVLVPTTILAQQHYNTFRSRFENYPIRVEVLSRFKTPKEQKQIIEDARKGLVDVIIGTHRIISKDIDLPNLGLVVIDEEQRFGVKHKESLKKIKSTVDVLTLSATPIPRTLHMSLSGIRDMSVIEEPPQERYPVITYVVEGKESIIQDEIEREIARGGQVFFVYNRVERIDEMASMIQRLVPDAKIAVAHGRMTGKELENIIIGFLNKEYNVLVCTTIIETGMDISNANTMIVYDADKMGLAQLYQLRGRVGRSNRQGYAYFMYEKDKVLSEIAEKRLKAIREFTEFGSGFKIAMRDLEIRGAGNILGPQQHGHMAVIGYDLYVKMLNEAIRKVKGEVVQEEIDVEVDLPVNAYIPDSYIDDEIIKIEMYKKIASIENEGDMNDIKDELADRFSDIPKSVNALISIAYIKTLCKQVGIEKIRMLKDEVILLPLTRYRTKEKNGYKIIDELQSILEQMCINKKNN
ncbi:transcription-repair coupling factor (TRCF ATP-dependent helicase mfd) [[Clostridium] sordellii]|uniref:transcription-repair coupling factor n=1 Tax=Paraclostridium sordellii TaxID=1505 RepID=UPI000542C2D1|nr:transcription-repair coupling factor [Paeniclostridium sordellii]MDU6115614.1 transcription-repair coupling factor [Paeniclostridium sordellii]CEK32567.1 transcription-repair coupling factor (TRCF ATP-dependent helicase mfd) [[Clostridium] sordellii] [Paeniclostridium sordellii]CEN87900.1 transcription-repair coupling factor (TRCF ATP-dependent helicase mfd) [[Clostridium] sordellii] [Paeniclostridium sordellii]CEO22524.1 transcription-repair coupling factor (TRCF ATP-dependent helicase mfd)